MLYFNDLVNGTLLGDTIAPQTVTGTVNGTAVDASQAGGNLINAISSVGAVSSLTSYDVKIQASPDGSTAWVDITGATFSQVTAASNLQVISFQLPVALNATALGYRYVRAVTTLVGTNVLAHALFVMLKHFPNPTTGYSAAPPTIN